MRRRRERLACSCGFPPHRRDGTALGGARPVLRVALWQRRAAWLYRRGRDRPASVDGIPSVGLPVRCGALTSSTSPPGFVRAPATESVRRIAPLHGCRQSRVCFTRAHPDLRARRLDSAGLPPHGVDACRLVRASSRPLLYRVRTLYHDEARGWQAERFVTISKQFGLLVGISALAPLIMPRIPSARFRGGGLAGRSRNEALGV